MAVELADAYAMIGFVGTITLAVSAAIIAGWRTAKWLLRQFTSLIDSRLDPIETKIDGLSLTVKSMEVVQNQHSERIAWLEGNQNQPLGSVSREKMT